MDHIDYRLWSDYLYKVHMVHKGKNMSALEIACGQGDMAEFLSKKFSVYFASDLSKEMLLSAKVPHNAFVCDMRNLPVRFIPNLILMTFDSINYLLSYRDLKACFDEIRSVMDYNTNFIFDISLEKNSLKFWRVLNRKGDFNGYFFQQHSRYDARKHLHFNRFDIQSDELGSIREEHIQRIYSVDEMKSALRVSGLEIVGLYDGFSLKPLKSDSLRAQFIIKVNNAKN